MALSLPEGRTGQLLAVGVLLLVVATVWTAIAAPLLDWYAGRADLLQREQLVVRHMRDLVATEPSLRREAMAMSAGGPPARAFVEANSDALGEAALQERLQAMAVAVATTLASMEVLPAQPAGGYRRIGVRVTLSAPWPAFVGLLHAVEHSAPRMLVGDLTLAGMPLAVRGTDLPLDIVMTVYAFRASTATAQ